MNELLVKYERLSPGFQKTLLEFLDFLLVKSEKSLSESKQPNDPWMEIGIWSEEDIQPILNAGEN